MTEAAEANGADPLGALPNAKDLVNQIALREAEKASEGARAEAAAEAEKKALLDRLASHPVFPTKSGCRALSPSSSERQATA